mmetsp:Transcript_48813/g.105159  ORF Transcript_48813/g.105159 Transcript_48813/m.105159 type:complete len:89 (+) Transcript_48813:148-414(+)
MATVSVTELRTSTALEAETEESSRYHLELSAAVFENFVLGFPEWLVHPAVGAEPEEGVWDSRGITSLFAQVHLLMFEGAGNFHRRQKP